MSLSVYTLSLAESTLLQFVLTVGLKWLYIGAVN